MGMNSHNDDFLKVARPMFNFGLDHMEPLNRTFPLATLQIRVNAVTRPC